MMTMISGSTNFINLKEINTDEQDTQEYFDPSCSNDIGEYSQYGDHYDQRIHHSAP